MATQLLDTPAKHPFSLTGLADSAWNALSETAIRATWGPLARVAESVVLSLMKKIVRGQLRVRINTSTSTRSHDFGRDTDGVSAEIRVRRDTFWIRLCLMGDLGFSEAYMYGDVECDDLVSLFKVFLMNKNELEPLDSTFSYLFTLPQKITSYRFLNTLSNSRSNVSAHYDISNEMFAGFLSRDMTYSCAIFSDLEGDLRQHAPQPKRTETTPRKKKDFHAQLPSPPLSVGSESAPHATISSDDDNHGPKKISDELNAISELLITKIKTVEGDHQDISSRASAQGSEISEDEDELYVAQLRKLDHIIEKLKIPDDRPTQVLEIGSGWGAMAIRIAQRYPLATVDTLTLSVQQQELARERIEQEGTGISSRIQVHLMDYRAMPKSWEAKFDRVVSVEMIEAVGNEFLEVYWKTIDWAMKPEKAVGVVQVITLPEARLDKYMSEIDFIRKWVLFPGGFLPTVTLLLQTLTDGSQGRFVIDSISNIGPHYARTLREWQTRFLEKFDTVIKPALMKQYPDVMGDRCADKEKAAEEIEVFKRKWIYYYCYCEVGFTTRTLGDHIITFSREGYEDYGCTVFE